MSININNLSAFHVLWTSPYVKKGESYSLSQAELLTLIISALLWRKQNGIIVLYSDKLGYEYIVSQKLEWLYDDIDTETLDGHEYKINPEIFWAAGKLIALKNHEAPCVMLDHDLIVTGNISYLFSGFDVCAFHPEELNPEVYINREYLKCPVGYQFPDQFDWNVKPLNTALLYVKNADFKKNYTNHAFDFMTGNMEYPKEFVSQMVFAEQRLLAMTAKMYGQKTGTVLNNPFALENKHFIHLWGYKHVLRSNPDIEKTFIDRLLKTFEKDLFSFSEFEPWLKQFMTQNNTDTYAMHQL